MTIAVASALVRGRVAGLMVLTPVAGTTLMLVHHEMALDERGVRGMIRVQPDPTWTGLHVLRTRAGGSERKCAAEEDRSKKCPRHISTPWGYRRSWNVRAREKDPRRVPGIQRLATGRAGG